MLYFLSVNILLISYDLPAPVGATVVNLKSFLKISLVFISLSFYIFI